MIFIDLYILGELMLFDFLRKPRTLAFWSAISAGLNTTQAALQSLFEVTKYDLTFNGQVIYLEHYLNDLYDPTLRRIYIEDTADEDVNYLFNKIENNELTYIHNTSEGAVPLYFTNHEESIQVVNFQVVVPSDIVFDELIFRKHVDKYRLAGKNYEIIIAP